MFCGKTEEAIRRARRAEIARLPVQAFAHKINTRDGINQIASRSGAKLRAITVSSAGEIPSLIKPETRLVVVDEANFFDPELFQVALWLKYNREIRAIYAGLDMDFRGLPFGPMGQLMSISTSVVKLKAVCMKCFEEEARYTQRLVKGEPASYYDPVIVVEDRDNEQDETYEARCRECWIVKDAPRGTIYQTPT